MPTMTSRRRDAIVGISVYQQWEDKHAAIKRTMGGRIDHITTNQKSVMWCVLRVGAVVPGETPPSNNALNREDDEPP